MSPKLDNIQGILLQVYRYPISRHLLFKFGDKESSRSFLRELLPRVTTGADEPACMPEPLLNLGLTCGGITTLVDDPEILAGFDSVFVAGPDPVALGDAYGSQSDPSNWWEGQFPTEDVHCILHLYFRTDAAVEPATTEIRQLAERFGVRELIPRRDGTRLDGRSLGGRKLHFGYTDGISHPEICWNDTDENPGTINFRHFVLGYSNNEIASYPGSGPGADLVRDSSYEVFRWLYQDVAAFNKFLQEEGPTLAPHLDAADAEELLAAKMMGRWRDGSPLVLSPEKPDPSLAEQNDFLYQAEDPNGFRCPFSAHIRVMNPRDQELDPVVVEPVPRVIRRGMPYGPPLDSTQDDGLDRGVIGMFLCSDIRRQIYTLTGWIKRNSFSPVFKANRRVQDPIVGNRKAPGASSDFIIPGEAGPVTLKGLPSFVHTRGTAFFLIPSLSTLRTLVGKP